MDPRTRTVPLAERIRSGAPVLLAYARSGEVLSLVDGSVFDAVVVPALRDAAAAHWAATAVLVAATDEATVRHAGELGLDGVLVTGAAAPDRIIAAAADVRAQHPAFTALLDERVASADNTLASDGVGKWVETAAAAERAFASGSAVVICDVAAALGRFRAAAAGPSPAAAARPALVLLPGMLGDASLWERLAELVSDVVLPVCARIDLDDSVAEMAQSVLAVAPETFYLCGHSLGGIVALEILRRAPWRVRGAVLANTSARAGTPEQQGLWTRWRDAAAAGGFDVLASELARSNLPTARRCDAELVAISERMAHAVGEAGFRRQLTAQLTRPESRDTLAAIGVPVVVVAADDDQVCPPELQRELAGGLPAARLVTVGGRGHMLPLEDPDALAAVVRDLVRLDVTSAQ